jgi:predicted HicB family RNase H-like nuclease
VGRPGGNPRTATAIRFKPEIHAQLVEAAQDRDLSINWLVNKAVEQFLDQLLPVDEIVYTRD